MTTTHEPLPGTIGLAASGGEVGKLIRLGQWLCKNPVNRWLDKNTHGDYQHAFVYLGDGKIIQAEPGGAQLCKNTHSNIYWCTNIGSMFTPEQLASVATDADLYQGTGYSFLDYFAIAAHRLHIPAPGLKDYIATTQHMICSQLADQMYRDKSMHVFTDNRWPGYVMPIDFWLLDQQLARKSH